MFEERDWRGAFCSWAEDRETLALFRDRNVTLTFEEYMEFMHRDRKVIFLVDTPDPEELHTDEEFEALFEEVPEAALEEAKEHLSSITKEKRTRAEKRHMIETLAAEGSMVVSEIAERVGVSAATVRRYIK